MSTELKLKGIRVTLLIGSFGWGGAERQALLLATGLAHRHQAAVTIVGLGRDGIEQQAFRQSGVQCYAVNRVESRLALLCAWRIRLAASHTWRVAHPQVVLAFTSPANQVAGAIAQNFDIPVIWGQRDEGLHRFHPQLERQAIQSCAWAVANGPGAAAFLACLGQPVERTSLISNGVMQHQSLVDRQIWRARLGITRDSVVVVMVANLTQAKDHPTLLVAWAHVQVASPHAHLVLAGAPGDRALEIQGLIEKLHLERIHQVGLVDDLQDLLAASDIAVLSSHSEGQPNGVLEPMAAGLPVIATDNPGCRSALPNGPLVPSGDAETLAGEILTLIRNPKLRERLGAANKERIARHFPVDAMVDRHAALIANVLLMRSTS